MSKQVRIELNSAGIRELLNSREVEELCAKTAGDMAARAGTGYAAAQPHHTGQRVAVNVYAETREARRDNLKNNTLLKVMR